MESRAAVRTWTLAVAGAICLGAGAGPARAQTEGHALDVSGPASAVVGQPVVLQATGHYPPTDFFTSFLDVHAIPASVVGVCPAGYLNSSQLSGSSYGQGGDTVAIAQPLHGDAGGTYSVPLAFTPRVPGRFLICGYANDAATWTHAMDTHVLEVRPAAGSRAPAASTVTVSQSSQVSRRFTRFRSLTLRGVAPGSTVVATCRYRGRRCSGRARRSYRKRDAAGTVSLRRFTRVRLRAGTVIRVRVTQPGERTRVTSIVTRRNRAPRVT